MSQILYVFPNKKLIGKKCSYFSCDKQNNRTFLLYEKKSCFSNDSRNRTDEYKLK